MLRFSALWTIFGIAAGLSAGGSAAAAGSSPADTAALCRSVVDGTACSALNQGFAEPGYGLAWHQLGEAASWQDAASACRRELGAGWRLPTLAELDAALDRTAFGYCSVAAWTATTATDGGAWQRGIAYEGEPVCNTSADGHVACVGGCGPYWMVRDVAPVTTRLGVICVRDAEVQDD